MVTPGMLLVVLALDGAAAVRPPAARIALAVDPRLPPAVRKAALEEADLIWRPYGVAVTAAGAGTRPTLTVTLADPPSVPPAHAPGAFASILFDGGTPRPVLTLYFDRLSRVGLSTVRVGSVGPDRWPPALRDRVLGRMAGRALAHEIGHWLLRSKAHSATGLMRAVQPATQMADAARVHYRLAAEDLVRLRESAVVPQPMTASGTAAR